MANVFISHRKADSDAAERLATELIKAGHSVWFNEWEIGPADAIVARIEDCKFTDLVSKVERAVNAEAARLMAEQERLPTIEGGADPDCAGAGVRG